MSVDIEALQQKQKQGLVAGVISKSGTPVVRLEIDDFIQDAELANLYFLALEAFMAKDTYKDPFQYYEVSGIHGEPARPWDNVSSVKYPTPKPSPGVKAPGYCSHGSVLFPTWHRVYLAQFEQALFLQAAKIAPALKAQAALDRFRLPYWDPLLPRQRLPGGKGYRYGIPLIFALPKIQVRRPGNPNVWVSMDNPLYRFDFPPDPKQPAINWDDFKSPKMATVQNAVKVSTIRGYDGSKSAADHAFVVKTFDENYNPSPATAGNTNTESAARLWRVMFDNKDFVSISNHTSPKDRLSQNPAENQNSIEGFHDDIHGFVGRGPMSDDGYPYGHMAFPSMAGFDPCFWLHHCNVDRLLAIWQGIHSKDPVEKRWWTSLDSPDGTFVEPPGVPETPTTALAPFRKSRDGNNVVWWNSNDVQDIHTLGYDYPQLVAARQSGDLVKGLISWANTELGWADPKAPRTKPGDQSAIKHFVEKQIPQPVPSFPTRIQLDGTTSLPEGTDYISSRSKSAQGPKLQVQSLEVDSLKGVDQTHDGMTLAAMPRPSTPSFQDRFGNLGDLITPDRKMTQWNATFSIEKYCLTGPFMIHFFLTHPSPTSYWLHDPSHIGTSSIFANPIPTSTSTSTSTETSTPTTNYCSSCATKAAQGFKYLDTVGLTPALIHYIRSQTPIEDMTLTDLSSPTTVEFLARNLRWKVVDVHGLDVPLDTVPSLKVGVYRETVTYPEHVSEVPLFEGKEWVFEVTQGKVGGLGPGESL